MDACCFAGYNEASSSSEATQHVNTRINVGHLSSTSDELTLRGAVVIGNGADSQITAKHTNLIGGMIANASWEMPEGADKDTPPILVDHGQLNFTTGTLTVEDLRDYSKSSQMCWLEVLRWTSMKILPT